MFLRAGLAAAVLLVPLSRGCSPEELTDSVDVVVDDPGEEVSSLPEQQPSPPPPPPRAQLAATDLLPYPAGSPEAGAASSIALALARLEANDGARALTALDAVGPEWGAPDLVQWLRVRALRTLDRPIELGEAVAAVPADSRFSGEATLVGAELALKAGEPGAALALLDNAGPSGLGARADLLRARALLARAQPGDREAAVIAAQRVWMGASGTQAEADAALLLDAEEPRIAPELRRGLAQQCVRGEALGNRGAKNQVCDLLDGKQEAIRALAATQPVAACGGLYQLGRAWHRRREYGRSVPVLQVAEEVCPPGDDAVKTLYLLGQGLARQGQIEPSIRAFVRLADTYPEHSYADDGLWQASRIALDEGRLTEAVSFAERLVRDFPDGDMAGPSLWNLAWAAIEGGRPADALPWLDQMAALDPSGPAREEALRGRYWKARVQLQSGASLRAAALATLEEVALDHPLDWYGSLAGWRLAEADPSRGARVAAAVHALALTMRAAPLEPTTFEPLTAFVDQPAARRAIALLRGGLLEDAAAEWTRALGSNPIADWDDDATRILVSHVFALAGDHHASHNLLRRAFKERFPPLAVAQATLLTHAYPRAFGDVLDAQTRAFSWDSLLFQGLVREESAFNPDVVSWAGATGLSQLMWPTAKDTARKMGIKGLSKADLRDPATNASIGATYLDGVAARWKGHLPLAIASYNAGPGSVNRWVEARGDLELDAWVETIPYDETRGYVKRVVGSWQIYRILYGANEALVPLRIGPVSAAIAGRDPVALTGS